MANSVALSKEITLNNGGKIKLSALFIPNACSGSRVAEAKMKLSKLVEDIIPLFEDDASFLPEETYVDEDGWTVTYQTKYIVKPDALTSRDKKMLAGMVDDGGLRAEGGRFYLTQWFTEALLEKYKVKLSYFLKTKFKEVIYTSTGKALTKNNLYQFVYYHCDSKDK